MGIMRIGRAEGRSHGRVYLKAWDEFDHHSLVLQEADSPGLDHFAFKVRNEADLELYEKRVEQFGCTRHAMTRAETTYFFDPSGNRNEAYSGGYITYSDSPTITWTEDKIAHGIFYHRREMIGSFVNALT